MEIERKFLVSDIPFDLANYSYDNISQGYICTSPVIRIRKKNNSYYLTCKSRGLMARQEFEIEILEEEYYLLSNKLEYNLIEKKRYYIPIENQLIVELDFFEGLLKGLVMAEVEFPSLEAANEFNPPLWLEKEVTNDYRFHNSYLCQLND